MNKLNIIQSIKKKTENYENNLLLSVTARTREKKMNII